MSVVDVSLVVCTRNRGRHLLAALQASARIVAKETWELVLVDNGSTDETAQVVAAFARSTTIDFRPIFEGREGHSCARNAGWRNARGAIVAFTDDDCYPAPDFVSQVARCMNARRLDYVGGKVLLHDPTDLPVTIQLRTTPLDIPVQSFLPAGLIIGANMSVRRSVLERLNGFDELLGLGTGFVSEDVEFLSRASTAGFAGGYDPGPVVSHHHRRKNAADIERINKGYVAGVGAYYTKCLLDKARRRQVLRHWYWSARQLPIGTTVMQIRAGLRYLAVRLFPGSSARRLNGAAHGAENVGGAER